MPGQVETASSWVREGLLSGLQSTDGISAEADAMWECGHILVRMIREAKGFGCTVCLYPCSDREGWQGGWKAVGVEYSLCPLWKTHV